VVNKVLLSVVLNNFINDSRVLKEGRSLISAGYDVHIVALHEDGLHEYETLEKLNINRIKLKSRGWPTWKPMKIIKYLEFLYRTVKRYRNKVDIIHCNDLDALPVGVLLKKTSKNNIKIIYDAHEYETETNGSKGIEKKLKKWLERILIRYADQVITVSESIAHEYAKLYSIPQPHLVLNCPYYRKTKKQNIFREQLNIRDDQTIFLYQGGLIKGRGIELILEVFSQFKDDKNVLVCMGYGPLESMIQEKEINSPTIFFHPAVSPEVLLKYTSSADYGIAFIEDTCLSYRYCLPNKIFEYLMAGLPVLASNLYEMKRLVESEGVGIVAQDNSEKGFKQAVVDSLKQDYSQIQSNVFEARKKYCWEEQEKVLRVVYSDIK
jgi:glycosyltransferase involved in cell wall biosynthesis